MVNPNSITYILLAGTVSFLFSLICTPFIVKICQIKNLYDQPDNRKVHRLAIPRLGGTLFMPSMGLGVVTALIAMYGGVHQTFDVYISTILLCIGSLLIYLIGILDDLNGMKAVHKFAIQLMTALAFPLCNLSINNLHGTFGVYDIPLYVSYPLTVFVILLIVNATNLIDGIDGLSSGLGMLMLIAFTYLFHQQNFGMFCLMSGGLTGAVLAFFIYNVFGKIGKNKIFMGDSGSLFIGYVVAYLAIKYQMSNEDAGFPYREDSLITSWTLVFIPCIDVIRVAVMRKLHHKNMFDADMTHIHHRIMQAGLTMHQTLGVIIALFFAICFINYGLNGLGVNCTWIMGADILLYGLMIFFLEQKPFRKN